MCVSYRNVSGENSLVQEMRLFDEQTHFFIQEDFLQNRHSLWVRCSHKKVQKQYDKKVGRNQYPISIFGLRRRTKVNMRHSLTHRYPLNMVCNPTSLFSLLLKIFHFTASQFLNISASHRCIDATQ